jgi:hypothetical protein
MDIRDVDSHNIGSLVNNDCFYDGLPVRLSDSGISHLFKEKIDPMTFCDMLQYPINCPKIVKKRKKFKRTSIELCSNRKSKIYRIILEKDYTINIRNFAYVLRHLEPV